MARLRYIQVFVRCLQNIVWDYTLVVAKLFNKLRNAPTIKPTNRREITYLIGMAEEDDRRPESSPFAGFTTQVYFREGPEFVVPTSLIRKCPKLIPDGTRWPPSAVRLDDVASNIAHVIFYYLLTGTYQSLRPKGSSHNERVGNELRTGVQSYNAARTYELQALQELAKEEIQRLSQELPFPLVLNLLRNLHLDPNEREPWLDDYVQSGLKDLFQTPTAFLDLTAHQVENEVVSFSNIILKSLANLLANDGVLSRKDIVAAPTPEPAAIEIEPAHEEDPVIEEVFGRHEEPVYESEVLQDTVEPAPSVQEIEPYSVVEPEPEPEPADDQPTYNQFADEPVEEPMYEHAHESAHEQYDVPRELEIIEPQPEPASIPEVAPEVAPEPEPEPEAEIESPPRAKYSPTEFASSPARWGWGWGDTTNKPDTRSLWNDDEPVSSPPDPVESPAPAADPPEAAIEYPEPVPVRDFSHVLDHRPVSEPTDDDILRPIAELKKSSSSKRVKKTLSIFRSAEDSTPDPPEPARVETPNPEPVLEPRITDEAGVLSPASSSGLKKKKKKKRSIFRSEDPL
ncbi:hypothetical protein F4678DRAFT_58120 [Xylaria arbuscula]|nr:hypothetical protein F4678DRAFT_58120 [Xylaria arbuscula]